MRKKSGDKKQPLLPVCQKHTVHIKLTENEKICIKVNAALRNTTCELIIIEALNNWIKDHPIKI